MLRHEHIEELCAAASAGQASGAELAEVAEHLEWCSTCQSRYAEFLNLNAVQYAKGNDHEELSQEQAVSSIDSILLRQRFLKKAAAEGIVFSRPPSEQSFPSPQIYSARTSSWALYSRIAAGILILAAVGASSYYMGRHGSVQADFASTPAPAAHIADSRDQERKAALAKVERENTELKSSIAALQRSLGSTSSKVLELESRNALSERERLAQTKEREQAIANLRIRLDQAQTALASLRSDYDKSQSTINNDRAQLLDDQIKLRDLSQQLAASATALSREREMLTANRDVRDLMAARNLHIVDVFDVGPKGKRRPAFGRIFYTEGKSLIFYAYDLPESQFKDAGYHYRIWGKKDGANQRAQSLGIFYSDDKNQKRWVFKYDDPKVLDEIDSIFVTLEPPNGASGQPKGDKLLSAYLKGPANHP